MIRGFYCILSMTSRFNQPQDERKLLTLFCWPIKKCDLSSMFSREIYVAFYHVKQKRRYSIAVYVFQIRRTLDDILYEHVFVIFNPHLPFCGDKKRVYGNEETLKPYRHVNS